ncbi:MAG: transposase [Pirellulales bacterium]
MIGRNDDARRVLVVRKRREQIVVDRNRIPTTPDGPPTRVFALPPLAAAEDGIQQTTDGDVPQETGEAAVIVVAVAAVGLAAVVRGIAGIDTRIVHPFASNHFRRPLHGDEKTDDNDLEAIFHAAIKGYGLATPPVGETYRALQAVSRHRHNLVKQRSRLMVQIRRLLHRGLRHNPVAERDRQPSKDRSDARRWPSREIPCLKIVAWRRGITATPREKTPVGVEPTSNRFAGGRLAE